MVSVAIRRGGVARRTALTALAAGVLAMAAACALPGAGGNAPSTSSSARSSQVATTGGGATNGRLAFAACMRAHGLPDFPDSSSGNTTIKVTNGQVAINGVPLHESAAQFHTASQACQSIGGAPGGSGPPNPQLQQAALAYAQCMRAHGLPNFPDPKVTGNSVQMQFRKGNGPDPSSPQFQQAQTACMPILSAGMKSAAPSSGGNG